MSNSRLGNIDFMRTIAIVLMIVANSAPYVLATPHSAGLRLISSLAAPLFIFLSGYSFTLSFRKNKDYKRKAMQAFYLLMSAVLIDAAAWRILPFQTFDVLYLISFGIFFNIIIFRFNWIIKISIAAVCIYLSFLLRKQTGYRFNIEDPMFSSISWQEFDPAWLLQGKRFLIDGWFPVFPWLSFSILGGVIAEKDEAVAHYKNALQWISLIFLAFGMFLLLNQNCLQGERDGYLELFYPPGIDYLLIALSFILFLYTLTVKLYFPEKFTFVNLIGRNSLLIYLLHIIVISYLFSEYFKPLNGFLFSLLMLLFILSCFLAAFLSEWLSKRGLLKFIPSGIKSILGLK